MRPRSGKERSAKEAVAAPATRAATEKKKKAAFEAVRQGQEWR